MPYTVSWLRTKRNPALLPGQWITLRKSAPRRGKQATFRPERKPPTTLDSACRPHPGPTSPPLPRPASSTQRRRRAAPPGVHRPPHAWSPCARRLQPVIGHVRAGSPARPGALPRSRWQRWGSRSLASAPSQEVRTAAAGASGPAPPQSGQRDRGLRAPPPLRPWLRVPLGSAPLGSGTCASGAAAPSSSASPGGQLLPAARRAFEPPSPVYGFPRQENFASVPTSISRPLPPPLPVGARARTLTHTLTLAGARAHGRAPGAAESPAPLLTRASSRHWASSVCSSGGRGDGGEGGCSPARSQSSAPRTESGEKRRRRARRRGGAAPRPLLVPRPQVSSSGGPAASLGRPGLERGFRGPAPPRYRDRGTERSGLGAGEGEKGKELEVRPGGRGAGEREGLRRSRPRPSLSCLSSTRLTFTSLGGGVGGGWVVPGAPGQPFRALSPAAASQCWLRDPRPPRAHHLPYTLDSAPRR